MSAVRDELHLSRKRSAQLVVGLVVLLGIPSALSFTQVGLEVGGVPFLDRMDQVTGAGILVILGLVGALILAWRLPRRRLIASLNTGRPRRGRLALRAAWIVTWASIMPLVAATLFLLTTVAR